MPRAAEPGSQVGLPSLVSKAAAGTRWVPGVSPSSTRVSQSPVTPARGRLAGGAAACSRGAQSEGVGGGTDDEQVQVIGQLGGGRADLPDIDRPEGGQAVGDRFGNGLGVAEHRFVHEQSSHVFPSLRAGLARQGLWSRSAEEIGSAPAEAVVATMRIWLW